MSLSITDSAAVALSYGRLAREFLAERGRPRRENSIGVNFFSDSLSVENPAMKLRALAERPRAVVPAKVPVKEPVTRLTKKEKEKEKENERNTASQQRSAKRSRPRSVKKSADRSRARARSKRRARTPYRRKPPMEKAMKQKRR